jgi:hypothetical protein
MSAPDASQHLSVLEAPLADKPRGGAEEIPMARTLAQYQLLVSNDVDRQLREQNESGAAAGLSFVRPLSAMSKRPGGAKGWVLDTKAARVADYFVQDGTVTSKPKGSAARGKPTMRCHQQQQQQQVTTLSLAVLAGEEPSDAAANKHKPCLLCSLVGHRKPAVPENILPPARPETPSAVRVRELRASLTNRRDGLRPLSALSGTACLASSRTLAPAKSLPPVASPVADDHSDGDSDAALPIFEAKAAKRLRALLGNHGNHGRRDNSGQRSPPSVAAKPGKPRADRSQRPATRAHPEQDSQRRRLEFRAMSASRFWSKATEFT